MSISVDDVHAAHLTWDEPKGDYVPVSAAPKRFKFVKGPIPLDWLQAAAQQPGKTLHVAIAIRYLAGLERSLTVRLRSKVLAGFGVERGSMYRALERLEKLGLITVVRKVGRHPVVSIVEDKMNCAINTGPQYHKQGDSTIIVHPRQG